MKYEKNTETGGAGAAGCGGGGDAGWGGVDPHRQWCAGDGDLDYGGSVCRERGIPAGRYQSLFTELLNMAEGFGDLLSAEFHPDRLTDAVRIRMIDPGGERFSLELHREEKA